MNTSESWGENRHSTRYTSSPISMVFQLTMVSD